MTGRGQRHQGMEEPLPDHQFAPRRLSSVVREIAGGVIGESQQVEGGQHAGQMLLAMPEIMLQRATCKIPPAQPDQYPTGLPMRHRIVVIRLDFGCLRRYSQRFPRFRQAGGELAPAGGSKMTTQPTLRRYETRRIICRAVKLSTPNIR